MANSMRVAVVERHPLFRRGVVETLRRKGLAVVAEGQFLADVECIVKRANPDILIIDIAMPGDSLREVENALRCRPSLKVSILTESEGEEDVSSALRAGASGYLLKSMSGKELVNALHAIHRGEPYICPKLAARLLVRTRGRPLGNGRQSRGHNIELSPREVQILFHLSKGLTNSEIAEITGINIRTTKIHITRIFRKVRARNRVEAVIAAGRMNLTGCYSAQSQRSGVPSDQPKAQPCGRLIAGVRGD